MAGPAGPPTTALPTRTKNSHSLASVQVVQWQNVKILSGIIKRVSELNSSYFLRLAEYVILTLWHNDPRSIQRSV